MVGRRYTHAIVSRIPDCFKTNAAELCGETDLPVARKQREQLRKVLRDSGLDVIKMPHSALCFDILWKKQYLMQKYMKILY
ncbi:dimethylargininase, partial [Caerostris darwini]